MSQQLLLLDEPADWRLDERTRRIGIRGVAEARCQLAEARRQADHDLAA